MNQQVFAPVQLFVMMNIPHFPATDAADISFDEFIVMVFIDPSIVVSNYYLIIVFGN